MREILFRGKRVDNGEWVEGELLHKTDGKPYIFTEDDFAGNEVLPETVGQWTGLYDKNKARIWEGDIVRIHNYTEKWKRGEPSYDWRRFEVRWNRHVWVFHNENISTPLADYDTRTLEPWDVELIGNIHDTPSLLNDKT